MKKLFDYCYYRIAKAYRVLDEGYHLEWGYWVLFASFFFVTEAMIIIIFHALCLEFNKTHVYIIAIPYVLLGLYTSCFISEKRKEEKYRQLEKKYKDERFRRLKGWLVSFYVIGTGVLLFFAHCVSSSPLL